MSLFFSDKSRLQPLYKATRRYIFAKNITRKKIDYQISLQLWLYNN